ncbi:MAG: HIT domain-containing protein [Pirellulales bacterium]|nr:HIT domain-containing protein [Pirellulales bacterium]
MVFEHIWAPWRLGYILGEESADRPDPPRELLPGADPECFLCRCAADPTQRLRLAVDRGEHTVTVLNRYPYNNGHLLIAPLRHVADLHELGDEVQLEISRTMTLMVKTLRSLFSPEGFNIGLNLGRVAGAGLPGHLHWHVVPRWNGDTNFMPTTAGVRVIPQSLEAVWEALTSELAKP